MNETNFGEKTPLSEIPQGDVERIQGMVDGYAEEHPGFSQVADGEIDDIVSRLIEKGQEVEPDVRNSLRNAVRFMLGMKVMERKE